MYKTVLSFLVVFSLASLLTGCDFAAAKQPIHDTSAAQSVQPVAGYDAALRDLDSHIASMEKWTIARPNSWPDWEGLANDYRRRAQLSGSYTDYAQAQAALETAFKVAPKGSGPFLSRAKLNFTMHRIFAVEPDLKSAEEAVILKSVARAQITALRADVAYCSGQYAQARVGFQQALELSPSPDVLGRMADYCWQTGDIAGARQRLDEAEKMTEVKSGSGYAVFLLQRGSLEIDAGNNDAAAKYFEAADKAFPGWWLVAEHRTRLETAKLSHDEQVKAWVALANKTQRAEDMDQVAQIYIHMHKHLTAAKWVSAASEIYKAQLKQFPEATYGHAVDHFINFEKDPAIYIEVAKENVASRPMGASHVKLAQAYLKAAQPEEALPQIESVLASPYNTTELHATAARIYDALGHTADAADQRAAALRLNPQFDENDYILGHSHH